MRLRALLGRTSGARWPTILLISALVAVLLIGVVPAVVHTPAGSALAGTGTQRQVATRSPSVMESQVSNDPSFDGGEPWVATDPRRPSIVLTTWTTTTENPASITKQGYCGLARSTDGGRTWAREATQHLWGTQLGEPGDVALAVAPDGTFYFECDLTASSGRIEIIKSTDDGLTWSPPVEVFGADRRPAAPRTPASPNPRRASESLCAR